MKCFLDLITLFAPFCLLLFCKVLFYLRNSCKWDSATDHRKAHSCWTLALAVYGRTVNVLHVVEVQNNSDWLLYSEGDGVWSMWAADDSASLQQKTWTQPAAPLSLHSFDLSVSLNPRRLRSLNLAGLRTRLHLFSKTKWLFLLF